MPLSSFLKLVVLFVVALSVTGALAINQQEENHNLKQRVGQLEKAIHFIVQIMQSRKSGPFAKEKKAEPRARPILTDFASQMEIQIEKRMTESMEKLLNESHINLNNLEKRVTSFNEEHSMDSSNCSAIQLQIKNAAKHLDTSAKVWVKNWEIERTDLKQIKNIINNWRNAFPSCNFSVNQTYGEGSFQVAAIHLAAAVDDVETVRFLIQKEANIHLQTKIRTRSYAYQVFPLHLATVHNSIQVLKLLLQNKAPVNNGGMTPLHMVRNVEIAELLIGNGANISAESNQKATPLHEAAKRENAVPIMKFLVEKGASVKAIDNYRYTPLHYSAENLMYKNAKFLIENGADVNAGSIYGKTPLHLAALQKYGTSMIKLLLNNGADINAKDTEGRPPLYSSFSLSISENAKFLIENGADIPAKVGLKGTSWFKIAIQQDDALPLLKLLLENGLDVNTKDEVGLSPLYHSLERKKYDCAKFLIEHGADINIKIQGSTPLHLAALIDESGSLTKLLLEKGANVNAKDDIGNTALYNSMRSSNELNARLLIQHGANVLTKFDKGNTLLHSAVCYQSKDLVGFLLDKKVQVNEQNQDGQSALHLAVLCNKLENIKLLIDRKANIHLEDKNGKTPYSLALSRYGSASQEVRAYFRRFQ